VTDDHASEEPSASDPGTAAAADPEADLAADSATGGTNPYIATVQAAMQMGIADLEDIRELIISAEGEQLRAVLEGARARISAGAQAILDAVDRIRAIQDQLRQQAAEVDASDIDLDHHHVRAQKALLSRTIELAEHADVESLYSLTASYSMLIPLWRWERPQQSSIEPDLED